MRSIALAIILCLGGATAATAQTAGPATRYAHPFSGDAALTYHWVRTNTQPGDCGCFYMNGAGLSGSLDLASHWAAVAEISGEYADDGPSTGNSLTLISYLAGARYRILQPGLTGSHALQPFGQLLVGAGHAGGGIAGAGDGTNAFVTRMGGGIDLPLNSVISLRLLQVDYYLTTFANSADMHQNNLLLGAGIVFHWSSDK